MEYELLAGLAEDDRRAVLSTAIRRRFKRNEVVFHEGDPGDTFHHIASGRVAIRVGTPAGDVATVAVLGPGDGFGEGAFLDPDSRRTGSAVALEATETLSITKTQFDDVRSRHATVDDLLIQHLATQVRRLTTQVTEALFVPADKRVLRRLLHLDALYAGAPIPLTQEDLATLAGTTRPTANRTLQQAVEAGLVAVARGRIEVLDRDGLGRRSR